VRLWDAESGEPVAELRGRVPLGYSWGLSPDGRSLATQDGLEVHLWGRRHGRTAGRPEGPHGFGSIDRLQPRRRPHRYDERAGAERRRRDPRGCGDAASGRQLAVMEGQPGSPRAFQLGRRPRRRARPGRGGRSCWDAEIGKPPRRAGGAHGPCVLREPRPRRGPHRHARQVRPAAVGPAGAAGGRGETPAVLAGTAGRRSREGQPVVLCRVPPGPPDRRDAGRRLALRPPLRGLRPPGAMAPGRRRPAAGGCAVPARSVECGHDVSVS